MNTLLSPDDPIARQATLVRVTRRIITFDIARLISQGSTLNATDKAISHVLATHVNSRTGCAYVSREELCADASVSLSTLTRSLKNLRAAGVWHVVPGKGGHLAPNERLASHVASRYFLREDFALGAMERLVAKEVARKDAEGKDAIEASSKVVDRIMSKLEIASLNSSGGLVAVEPGKVLIARRVAPEAAAAVVADEAPLVAVDASAPTAAPEVREWNLASPVVATFLRFESGRGPLYLDAIEKCGDVAAINALVAAASNASSPEEVEDALSTCVTNLIISGGAVRIYGLGAWVLSRLEEINGDIARQRSSFDEVFVDA